jgi:hypothetical protein
MNMTGMLRKAEPARLAELSAKLGAARLAGLAVLLVIIVAQAALAANNPGHDSLYVLKLGNSDVAGSINITGGLNATLVRATGKFFGDYLDIVANGTVGSSLTNPAIQAGSGSLYIDSTSAYINTKTSTGLVQVGNPANNLITLNVSGTIMQQNVKVCLANGTNCLTGTNTGGNITTISNGAGISVTNPNGPSTTIAVDNTVCRSDGTNCKAAAAESDPLWDGNSSTVARAGTCPAGQVVQNTTNGGVQCVTMSTGSGTVSSGSANKLAYYASAGTAIGNLTGANNGAIYYDGSGNVQSGTLPVASGGTGVTTSTGSGNVVLSASPTLTGTPTISGNVTFSGGTQYLVTAFTAATLTIRAGGSGGGGGPLYLAGGGGGAGGAGSVYVTGGNAATDTGVAGDVYIYGGTATGYGNVFLAYNGSRPLGKVGLGTKSPSQLLDVNGSINVSGAGAGIWVGAKQVCLSDGTNCKAAAAESDPLWSGNQSLYYLKSNPFGYYNSSTFTDYYPKTINPLGYYNSTTLPATGYQSSAGGWTNTSTTTSTSLNIDAGNGKLYVNSTSGNVGIGTANPGMRLDVSGGIARFTDTSNGIGLNTMGTVIGRSDGTNDGGAQFGLVAGDALMRIGKGSPNGGDAGVNIAYDTTRGVGRIFLLDAGRDFAFGVKSSGGSPTPNALYINNSGNIGIGTTNPQSLLDITTSVGDDTISAPLRISNTAGSASGRPAISFFNTAGSLSTAQISSSPGSGYLASKLFFSVADGTKTLQDRMVIDTNGNVGIGTTTPQALLSLGNAVNAQKLLLYDNNNNNKYGFGIQANELRAFFPSGASFMSFGTVSSADGTTFSEKMRIQQDGNVGIGTTNPNATLDIVTAAPSGATYPSIGLGTTNASQTRGRLIGPVTSTGEQLYLTKNLYFNGSAWNADSPAGNGAIVALDGGTWTYPIALIVSGMGSNPKTITPAVQIRNDSTILLAPTTGNVGIGTASPKSKLDVAGSIILSDPSLPLIFENSYYNGSAFLYATSAPATSLNFNWGLGGNFAFNVAPSGTAGNTVAWTTAMFINNGGNVGIGTTTPTQKLEVNGDLNVSGTGNIYYQGNLTGYGADVAEYIAGSDVEAGDVVILSPDQDKAVARSAVAYDTRVAGIVSTRPSHIMGAGEGNVLLALAGRVPVKVTNETGPIRRGDLLTTSSTPGHAMRCADRTACSGAIVGKAMEPFDKPEGTITALVVLG